MTDDERERERAEFIEKYAPWYKKMKYHPMLQIPAEPWNVDASWRDAYFHASKEIIQGVVDGRLMPAIQGVAGVFMFRHYMELAMKYTVFHARWLASADKNAAWGDVKDLHRNHSLMAWWNDLKGETKGKIPKGGARGSRGGRFRRTRPRRRCGQDENAGIFHVAGRIDHDRPALALDQHRVGVGEADGDPHAVGDLDHLPAELG